MEDGSSKWSFRRSRLRFASSMRSIMEKYNFPFDNDVIISIKSLTFESPDGLQVWGEESSDEISDCFDQNTVQCKENTETQQQQMSDFENEEFESSEEQFTNTDGESRLEFPDHQSHNELASIKSHFENIHIKESIPLAILKNPTMNKCRLEMDILTEVGATSLPRVLRVTRTTPNFHLCVLKGESIADHHSVVLRKEAQSDNGYSAPRSPRLYNIASPDLASLTTGSGDQSFLSYNEAAHSSFVQMYESADEQCSWNNVTIADLYPGMVKSLSRLIHKASSASLIKRYRHGSWQPKHGSLNTTAERIRKSRPLKIKAGLRVTKDDRNKNVLPMAGNKSNSPLDDNSQFECSVDRMEVNPSDTVEDAEKIRVRAMETIILPNNISTEETFIVKSLSCNPSSSDCARKSRSERNSSAMRAVDSGSTLFPSIEDKSGEVNTLTVQDTAYLSFYESDSDRSSTGLMSSPVTISDNLLGNHETKIFRTAVSLQRSHSLSSLPVPRSPFKARQKCDDAFEKMYKELCFPKDQKPVIFPNINLSPRKSIRSHFPNAHLKSNEMFDNIYQEICSGRFLKIPTFMRAAHLKKYEGIQMSETVNALVNSPIRTIPAVARIKRAANFCNEDVQSSPLKRLKNISENSPREYQRSPYWKNVNLQKTNVTSTLHNSHLDPVFCDSSNCNFLDAPKTYMQETKTACIYENRNKSLQNCGSLKLQSCPRGVSRKLSYSDRRIQDAATYVEGCKDYRGSLLQGCGEDTEETYHDFAF